MSSMPVFSVIVTTKVCMKEWPVEPAAGASMILYVPLLQNGGITQLLGVTVGDTIVTELDPSESQVSRNLLPARIPLGK